MAGFLAEVAAPKSRKLPIFVLAGAVLAGALTMLAGCSHGNLSNPFASKPFVPTRYPRDFAVVIDQDRATYFARQEIHQTVSAADMLSRTTYTTFSDYKNTVASHYTTVTPVTRNQLQNMWNEVRRHHLLRGAFTWYYWKSSSNRFHQDRMTMQIRANGRERVYHQLNHWDSNKAGLALDCQAVRFAVTQNAPAQFPTAAPARAGRQGRHHRPKNRARGFGAGMNGTRSGANAGSNNGTAPATNGGNAAAPGRAAGGGGANSGTGTGGQQNMTAPNIFPTPAAPPTKPSHMSAQSGSAAAQGGGASAASPKSPATSAAPPTNAAK